MCLAQVGQDQLDKPCPCDQWSIRDLLSHVIGGNIRVAGAEFTGLLPEVELGIQYEDSSRLAIERFERPGALSDTFKAPFGEIPGSIFIVLRTTDVLVHSWDLARANGENSDFEPELASEVLEVSAKIIRPDLRGPGRPFAPEVLTDPSASPMARLVAFLGRDPYWGESG